MDFQKPPLPTDDEIVEVLTTVDQLMSWAKDVQEFALTKAMNENKQWPGMKLVEGRGSRKYSDENAVVEALSAAGYDGNVIYKKTINTITNGKEFKIILLIIVLKGESLFGTVNKFV